MTENEALQYARALRIIERQLVELAGILPAGRNTLEDLNLLFIIEDIAEYRLSGEYDEQLTETTANEAFARVVSRGLRFEQPEGEWRADLESVEGLLSEVGA